ncbi:hypothetical protein CRE_11432 [Caenorhabditis remanei]|uniref:F-box domain-containing protein n=1 Tax=Caenorhabditis remanei TaxID=31234 RepID=E3NBG3_CAERE|nr:hypothetical protein CRE_11432 [Caenorhabditis remanei]
MTDIDPSSLANLRALMLYDISQRKTMRESIENHRVLCKHLGKKAISNDEYELCFNRCLNENYHSVIEKRDLPIPDIPVCILSNVVNGKSAEKAINDLCEAIENYKIDKDDHDYWFKRFKDGQSFTRVTFSDFPEDVVAEIVEKCDIQSYLNLRNVSHGLQTVIDHLAPPCTDIGVYCEYGIKAYVDDTRIANSEHFDILELLLRIPKLRLKRFWFITSSSLRSKYPTTEIEIPPRYCKKHFLDLLNSLNHKIHAKKCMMKVNSKNDVIEVLKCLKPGTLENLDIDTGFVNEINEAVNMNQWKLAKHLKITTSELPSIENFFHFSTFELGIESITMEDMVKLCEVILIISYGYFIVFLQNASKTNRFQYCEVQIQEKFELETIKRALNLQPTSSSKIYTIPNTNLFIQFISANIFESKQKFGDSVD